MALKRARRKGFGIFGSEPQFAQGTKSSQFQTQFNTAFTISATFEQETDLSVLHIATALTTAYISASSRTPHNWRLKSARTLAPASFVRKGRWIYLVHIRLHSTTAITNHTTSRTLDSRNQCRPQSVEVWQMEETRVADWEEP
ncbi:hypothetical protein ARMGADRAFT_1092753 [Armillaria gallica]|uniref:Uncharacterized protein n=1 Tax=Armillaria gallica TaxID=47427 RepID=A0A2H3CLC7_ARMGA|nr:hypothetical protein ARMGADRAFT_1093375 [Armillaria gallica]PBK79791.1 hypothetical protein ARMGADRAFT_1092753 [Armillaria gallica]